METFCSSYDAGFVGSLSVAALLAASCCTLGMIYSSKSIVLSSYHKYDSSTCRLLSNEHLEPIALRQWKVVLSWVAFHPDQVATLQDTKHQTILHHACLFRAPAHVMESILCAAPELASMANRDGELPLHWAIRLSTPNPVLQLLLEANPETAFWKDNLNATPLSLLWERHYTTVLRTWREHPEFVLELNSWKRIVSIFRAVHRHNRQERQYQYADEEEEEEEEPDDDDDDEEEKDADNDDQESLDESDRGCRTNIKQFLPLHIAASRPCPPGLFSFMMQLYDTLWEQKDRDGQVPLMIACYYPIANRAYGVCTKVQYLLQENRDATAAQRDLTGRYPLHAATISGIQWKEGVKDLFRAFPQALTIRDPLTDLYPFQLAAAAPLYEKQIEQENEPQDMQDVVEQDPRQRLRSRFPRRRHEPLQPPTNTASAAGECNSNQSIDHTLTTIYRLLRSDPSVLLS